MKNLPIFDIVTLEELSKVLAEEASGAELTRLFLQIHVKEESNFTKWKRIYDTLNACQQSDHSSARIFEFIKTVLNPIRYTNSSRTENQYNEALQRTNIILSFSGYKIDSNSNIIQIKQAQNIEEALQQARNFYRMLISRKIHSEILKYCKPEALQENYFHAVFEAIKGLTARIKEITGLDKDGITLINMVFSAQKPYLAINSMQTQSEKDELDGFRFLIIGIITMFRNPISHEAKINWQLSGDDGLDILTTLSLIHRRLDTAVLIRHD